MAAIHKRCAPCHVKERYDKRTRKKIKFFQLGRGAGGRGPIYNISRPEKSLLVRAMLAKEAGGLALSNKVVFRSTSTGLPNDGASS